MLYTHKQMWAKYKQQPGFTIVELLIVVVVIAILAAVTIVSYNGIQARAKVSASIAEIKSVNSAIQLYHAENGVYPSTGGVWNGLNQEVNYVPLVIPKYISKLPQLSGPVPPTGTPYTTTGFYPPAYAYRSDGINYKLMAHNNGLCGEVKNLQPVLVGNFRDCWAYGYWTPGAVNW
jgi:prepilin-type N-terminal cleavage/methylation domain-containing protein